MLLLLPCILFLGDVTSHTCPAGITTEEYMRSYFSVPEGPISRGSLDPCEVFEAAEAEIESESSLTPDQSESPLIKRLQRYSLVAFGRVREFANFAELKQVTQDASALPLQPLLIRLRILGPDHPDTIYFLR